MCVQGLHEGPQAHKGDIAKQIKEKAFHLLEDTIISQKKRLKSDLTANEVRRVQQSTMSKNFLRVILIYNI